MLSIGHLTVIQMPAEITLRTFFFKDNVIRKSILLAGDFNTKLLPFEQNKKVQNFDNVMLQPGLVPATNKSARTKKGTISAIDYTTTNSIINNKFKTAILTADISDHFPIIYTFKLKAKLDIHKISMIFPIFYILDIHITRNLVGNNKKY